MAFNNRAPTFFLRRGVLALAAAAILSVSLISIALARTWPNRPVKLLGSSALVSNPGMAARQKRSPKFCMKKHRAGRVLAKSAGIHTV